MTKRRRFTDDFKARVALEALRGDKTVQEIASKHKVHPNQVSTWKRQAIDGLADVFSTGPERVTADHEAEIHDLHAKVGQLMDLSRFCAAPGARLSHLSFEGDRPFPAQC